MTSRKLSLKNKIIFCSILLVLISSVFTICGSYFVGRSVVYNKVLYINRMLSSTAQNKANTVFGEIESIVNMASNNDLIQKLFNAGDEGSYEYLKARQDYTKYLNSTIISYDKINAIAVFDGKSSIVAYNTSYPEFAPLGDGTAYKDIVGLAETGPKRMNYLYKLEWEDYERFAIVTPISESFAKDFKAYIVVVLNKSFASDLQFAGDKVYITDQDGNQLNIVDKSVQNTDVKGSKAYVSDLIFDGWKIVNEFDLDWIKTDYGGYLTRTAIFCFLYLLLILALTGFVAFRLVKPVLKLGATIKNANIGTMDTKFENTKPWIPGFKTKVLIFYFFVVLIPIVGVTGYFYLQTKYIIENKVGYVFQYNANLLSQQLDFAFDSYMRTIKEVAVDKNVQGFMAGDSVGETDGQQYSAVNMSVLRKIMNNKVIMNVALFDRGMNLYYSSFYNMNFFTKPYIKDDIGFVLDNYGRSLWRVVPEKIMNKESYRVGMQLIGVDDNSLSGRVMGCIFIDYDLSEISRMINDFKKTSNAEVYLVDEKNDNMLADSDGHDVHKAIGQVLQDKSMITISKEIAVNGWKLYIIVTLKEYLKENNSLLIYSLIILAGMFILSFIFSYSFSSVLGTSISMLLEVVKKVDAGNLSLRFESRSNDEIGILGESFNHMLDRLNTTIHEKMDTEVKMKDAEIRAKDLEIRAKEFELNLLQAQINPHFLYNTLRTLQCMVFLKDPRTEKMVNLLINLFKTGINKGEKSVPLAEEIGHVKTYLVIQQIRLEGKFDIVYDIDEDVLDCNVMKLTLQPIVENAINHGIDHMSSGGLIKIEAGERDGKLVVRVSDNGIGMSEQQLQELNQRLMNNDKGKSIGVVNVNERVRLQFGNEYGISIESKLNAGTSFILSFPVQRKGKDG